MAATLPPGEAAAAVAAAHDYFERASGWAPPSTATIAEWFADGVCRCPDECLVAPDGRCEHGLASWWLILNAVRTSGPPAHWDPALLLPHPDRFDLRRPDAPAVLDAHEEAVARGDAGYLDPATGLFAQTARTLFERGTCCDNRCRHCPWVGGAGAPTT